MLHTHKSIFLASTGALLLFVKGRSQILKHHGMFEQQKHYGCELKQTNTTISALVTVYTPEVVFLWLDEKLRVHPRKPAFARHGMISTIKSAQTFYYKEESPDFTYLTSPPSPINL